MTLPFHPEDVAALLAPLIAAMDEAGTRVVFVPLDTDRPVKVVIALDHLAEPVGQAVVAAINAFSVGKMVGREPSRYERN